MEEFGKKFKAWRESKGVSQTDIRKAAGIAESNLSNFESGRRSISPDILKKIAMIPDLEISYETLMAWNRLDRASDDEKAAIFAELIGEEKFFEKLKAEVERRGLIE